MQHDRTHGSKRNLSDRQACAGPPHDATCEKASASDQSQQDQQHDRAHGRGDDGTDPPNTSNRRQTEDVPQPGADITADNADDEVPDQTKASALQDFPASQPAIKPTT